MELPLEILSKVFNGFEKSELKIIRSVCKPFERAASQLLFDKVIISNNYICLQKAEMILKTFSSSIKTIFFCPVSYVPLTRKGYERKCKEQRSRIRDNDSTQHLDQAYLAYSELMAEEREISQSGICTSLFSIALSNAINARTLIFGERAILKPRWDSTMSRLGVHREDLCQVIGCTMETQLHFDMYFKLHGWGYRSPINEIWYPAMYALHVSNSRIPEITIESYQDGSWSDEWSSINSLSVTVFDLTSRRITVVLECFERLTKLQLEIAVNDLRRNEEHLFRRGDLAVALSNAQNLQTLRLQVATSNTDGFTEFDGFLGGCRFPRLHTLTLNNFEVSETDLLGLIKGSPHLEDLHLRNFYLFGSWASVADGIRDAIRLKKVYLYLLTDDCRPLHEPFWWPVGSQIINDFFLFRGANPFTT